MCVSLPRPGLLSERKGIRRHARTHATRQRAPAGVRGQRVQRRGTLHLDRARPAVLTNLDSPFPAEHEVHVPGVIPQAQRRVLAATIRSGSTVHWPSRATWSRATSTAEYACCSSKNWLLALTTDRARSYPRYVSGSGPGYVPASGRPTPLVRRRRADPGSVSPSVRTRLPVMDPPDLPSLIDEVVRRPVALVPRSPRLETVVDRDRVLSHRAARRCSATFGTSRSKANSGLCTPITVRPFCRYFASQSVM